MEWKSRKKMGSYVQNFLEIQSTIYKQIFRATESWKKTHKNQLIEHNWWWQIELKWLITRLNFQLIKKWNFGKIRLRWWWIKNWTSARKWKYFKKLWSKQWHCDKFTLTKSKFDANKIWAWSIFSMENRSAVNNKAFLNRHGMSRPILHSRSRRA